MWLILSITFFMFIAIYDVLCGQLTHWNLGDRKYVFVAHLIIIIESEASAFFIATGEMPVCFQWSSSGFPVVFQCVPIMQINTGSPLVHHWVQASASVVPVASQCTCGSSGLPVCSNHAN